MILIKYNDIDRYKRECFTELIFILKRVCATEQIFFAKRNLDLATQNLIANQISIYSGYSCRLPRDTQLPPYSDSGGGFLVPLDLEGTELQSESRRGPLHEMR